MPGLSWLFSYQLLPAVHAVKIQELTRSYFLGRIAFETKELSVPHWWCNLSTVTNTDLCGIDFEEQPGNVPGHQKKHTTQPGVVKQGEIQ